MNVKQIRALVAIMENSGLSVLEISNGEDKIRLEKQIGTVTLGAPVVQKQCASNVGQAESSVDQSFPGAKELKSPMVGVFYPAPTLNSEPFVAVGSLVKKGDVLCIIEAMKLMNEICAECDGTIVEICAESGQLVEFGQPLFKIL